MSSINAWVYLFSRFTAELILFESLIIFVLLAFYSGYWILVKRRMGLGSSLIPAEVVKHYLGDLIVNAEGVKTQLFGEVPLQGSTKINASGAMEFTLLEKISELENKINEKEKLIQNANKEKEKIEKELSQATSAPSKEGFVSASGIQTADVEALKEKIQNLEERLAEYSVIEDDLANLKKLQQENVQLKSLLNSSGIPVPDLAQSVKPQTASPSISPTVAPTASPSAPPIVPPIQSANTTPAPQATSPTLPEPKKAPMPAPPPAAATTGTNKPVPEKSDEDLVAEFEKMLKS
ncbi:MAG: hypothetical protein HY072_06560 [Deltaproteobacteria bacterium]|nr:hypothetical protein [Deltaproteobacteria bacterium]